MSPSAARTASTRPIYGRTISAIMIESYWLYASKAGEHYLSVIWDQTPHFYSTSAQTPWFQVGTSFLTLPGGLSGQWRAPRNHGRRANRHSSLLHPEDIGIQRNTAAVGYRWTPTDAWDFRADYSHMTRGRARRLQASL